MGTNFYTLDGKHIGKTSYVGVWCWKCYTRAKRTKFYSDDIVAAIDTWTCPECGTVVEEAEMYMAWYNRTHRQDEAKDVAPALMFTWQIGESGIGETLEEVKSNLTRRKYLKADNSVQWTIKDFQRMIECGVISETYIYSEFT